ncbi:MAG: phosphoribosyltransferase domain-containing protein [Pseudomonadota bacterium]
MTPVCDTAASLQRLSCQLEAGRLEVEIARAQLPAKTVFGFGERNNPRRAFLFVSQLLGRHIPVAPTRMRAAFSALAAQIDADLPGPVLMTGMAETAVGLGAGVHDAYCKRTGRDDVLYLATTRHRLGPIFAEFSEDHSHASHHLVHWPGAPADRALLAAARSLVMVDDEASSGATFHNLHAALTAGGLPQLQCVATAVLTDWSAGKAAATRPGEAWARHALLSGRFRWWADAGAPSRILPDPDLPRAAGIPPRHRVADARRGRRSPLPAPQSTGAARECLAGHAGPVQVLGMGEHVWEPFLLAEALEATGLPVRFSATTRSPILPGHAIRSALRFWDHEGIGIGNYLYNCLPHPDLRVLLCCDTALSAIDPRLIASFRADLVLGDDIVAFRDLPAAIRGAEPLQVAHARDDPCDPSF